MSQKNEYTHPAYKDNHTSFIEASANPHATVVANFLDRIIHQKNTETAEELMAIIENKENNR